MFRVGSALRAAVSCCCAFGLLAVPAGAAQADRCPGALDVPTDRPGLDRAADAVVCLVNAERTSRGLKPLRADTKLGQAARRHASDMVQRAYFGHVSPSGDSVGDRVRAAGYGDPRDGWLVGENLAWGTGRRATPNRVVDAWLGSEGHRRIMLRPEYREFGIAAVAGAPKQTTSGLPGATYTLNFGVLRP
jgi:uncharacterized protein YkwD